MRSIAAADQRIATAKKTEEALLASNKELEKANQQMATDKAEIARLKTERTQLAKTAAEEKAAMAKALQDRSLHWWMA